MMRTLKKHKLAIRVVVIMVLLFVMTTFLPSLFNSNNDLGVSVGAGITLFVVGAIVMDFERIINWIKDIY